MDTDWFIALAEAQARQDTINSRERWMIPYHSAVNIHGLSEAPELLSKREVGRPSTDWRIVDKVLQIYDSSVEDVKEGKTLRPKSLRAIAREMDNVIGYVSVRNILREYRKEIYHNVKILALDKSFTN